MILKDYYVDWIISWVAYWITFMFVFFTLEKLVLKSGSTPCYLSSFSSFFYHNPDNSLILGGSIEKTPAPSTASWHLVDRSSFCSWIWCVLPRYLLYISAVDDHFLDTYLNSFLDTFRHLHRLSFIKGLYILSLQSVSHFFNLSRSVRTCSSPKLFLSHTPNHFLWDFLSFFKILLLLVSF